jgi:hypothetical protein
MPTFDLNSQPTCFGKPAEAGPEVCNLCAYQAMCMEECNKALPPTGNGEVPF